MMELEQGIGFQSLQEAINTITPGEKLGFIFSARWPSSSAISSASGRASLAAPRARGGKGGRPKRLNPQQRSLAVDLFRQKKHSTLKRFKRQ
jgi:DNA invertase Pin-like site-specific DNA recombinase